MPLLTEESARLIVEAGRRGDREAVRILGGLDPLPLDAARLNHPNQHHPVPSILAMIFPDRHTTTTEQVYQWADRLGVECHVLIFDIAE
jgi:hypothetical protein